METCGNMKKCIFIIPYFGKIPDYYDLWKKSVAKNSNFTFLIYSDLAFDTDGASNIVVKKITFEQLRKKIQMHFEFKISLKEPYKLCDYKPAYGMIFEEDIRDFDFWGFCDMDLIFGDIGKFITSDILQEYDKILNHGHFTLFRNNHTMNRLFLEKYDRVMDYRYAFTTDYCCHFDERGTVAFASEFSNTIQSYVAWVFYDVPTNSYPLIHQGEEAVCIWENGHLTVFREKEKDGQEILYVHLQKRKMKRGTPIVGNLFAIRRNEFIAVQDDADITKLFVPIDIKSQLIFLKGRKSSRQKELINNLRTGALKCRFYSWKHKWRSP